MTPEQSEKIEPLAKLLALLADEFSRLTSNHAADLKGMEAYQRENARLRAALREALNWHATMMQPCAQCGGADGCHVGCEAHPSYVRCEAALYPPAEAALAEGST
jgi:hypothetical protein